MHDSEPAAGTPQRGRLLIVDDDRMQRLIMATVARRAGFETDEAASLAEVRDLTGQKSYVLALIDLSLGDGDGVEVIRHLATLDERPGAIVVSAFDQRIRRGAARFAQTLGLAVVAILRKPLDLGELRSALVAGPEASARREPAMHRADITREQFVAALENGEVSPFYQPKLALQTRKVVGAEALARWTNPQLGVVPPEAFIPQLDAWGLSSPLTALMLERATLEAARWPEDVGVAVNVSTQVLSDIRFPDRVRDQLAASGLPPQRLTLEVTETTALSDDVVTADVLTRLRIRGVQLSLDDFGTGYSSLASLLAMPFGELKLDRSFVAVCDRDPYAWKIVRATLALARELGMSAVAEGVDREALAQMLCEAGCEIAQGFLFSPALSAEEFRALVAEGLAERRAIGA